MKILSWNINGIRASKIDLKKLFDSLDADVICLQETKVTRDQLDEPTAIVEGYSSYFSFSKKRSGYSGVANFCRNSATPVKAEEGLSGLLSSKKEESIGCYGNQSSFTHDELESLDAEGRAVITQHKVRTKDGEMKDLVIINVYCPRADPEREDRLIYKLRFYALLQTRAEALLQNGFHVVVLGDINSIHKRQDTADIDQLEEVVRKPSRVWLNQFLCEKQRDATIDDIENREEFAGATLNTVGGQFMDTFRHLHPDKPDAFTNWCTLTAARATNYGRRLDFIFADIDLTEGHVVDSDIMADVEGSDHCPVRTGIDCECIPSQACPPLCTKYMPEFTGKQTKLSTFFAKKQIQSKTSVLTASGDRFDTEREVTQQPMLPVAPAGSVKRAFDSKSSTAAPSNKRKKSENLKINMGPKQSSLINFFGKKNESSGPAKMDLESKNSVIDSLGNLSDKKLPGKMRESGAGSIDSPSNDKSEISTNSQNLQPVSYKAPIKESDSGNSSANAWKNLLKGLGPVPLCKGHNEPCVLRMVKKPGPNKGKQFYVCNRGEGLKSNPEARCDFFKWVETKKAQ